MPRHPPCALDNLTNTHIKKSRHKHATETKDARVHCTILNDHTNQRPHPVTTRCGPLTVQDNNPHRSSPQDPTACRPEPTSHRKPREKSRGLFGVSTFLEQPPPTPTPGRNPGPGRYWGPPPPTPKRTEQASVNTSGRRCPVKLLRKEVIQPHLPVRLPCYDFVPIASPTFDRSPPCGLGHGLRVLPTFVT